MEVKPLLTSYNVSKNLSGIDYLLTFIKDSLIKVNKLI